MPICVLNTPTPPSSSNSNSNRDANANRPTALNPNNCPVPQNGYHACGWGTLTIRCSDVLSWYACETAPSPTTPPPTALNPNSCPVPQHGNTNQCLEWGTLTICCNESATWYNCDGQCSWSGSNVATIDEY